MKSASVIKGNYILSVTDDFKQEDIHEIDPEAEIQVYWPHIHAIVVQSDLEDFIDKAQAHKNIKKADNDRAIRLV